MVGDFSGISFSCVDFGADGKFCGAPCSETAPCPDGYTCETVAEGVTECVISSGQCQCTDRFKAEGAVTECYKENEFGKCFGEKTCESECSASTPEKEKCRDGIDNDCNGQTDEAGCIGCSTYYKDQDNDGFGVSEDSLCLESPQYPYTASVGGDCDDTNASIKPGATEICNGVDDNCDGQTDPAGTFGCQNFYPDADGDGYGAFGMPAQCLCQPQGTYTATVSGDCNDNEALAHPGAIEVCDGIDNDCNGQTDEGLLVTYYQDQDGDGFGGTVSVQACAPPQGYVLVSGDCDDTDAGVNPGATEVCGNGKDDNCNNTENDEGATGCELYYEDKDSDGYGAGTSKCLCFAEGKYATKTPGDCDDNDPLANPGLPEKCSDGKDNNCNGQIDEAGCVGCTTYFKDEDHDGFGVSSDSLCLGAPQQPYTALVGNDCDDTNPNVKPTATEICNGIDDNCDGTIDPAGTFGCQNFYPDADGDGYGALGMPAQCYCQPQGIYTAIVTGDCNDGDAQVHPGASEVCDGVDNNCNGQTDENLILTFYQDLDGDGFGSSVSVQGCTPPQGFVTRSGDCDDNDPVAYPGATEVCDGKDNDCDGNTDEGLLKTFYRDFDGDGWGGTVTTLACSAPPGYVEQSGDCNDFNKDIHPQAQELCNDLDDDCNGLVDDGLPTMTIYKDNDGDGYAAANAPSMQKCNVPVGWTLVNNPPDCNDSDITVYPGAPEICNDGKDNDCDGFVDRLCFTQCAGNWPYLLQNRSGSSQVQTADLDGDGMFEVIVQNNFGFAIVSYSGQRLFEYSGTQNNYSRGLAVTADIDNYDSFGAGIQTLEVLTGNGGRPRFYKLNPDRTVTLIENTDASASVFDNSKFMVADMDNDGIVEFVAAISAQVDVLRIFRYNRSQNTIDIAKVVQDPDHKYNYADGRILTDLSLDGVLDLVFSNGAAVDTDPSLWSGKIHAYTVTNPATIDLQPFCSPDPVACFSTVEGNLYPGGVWWLIRFPEQIAAEVFYYESNTPGLSNPMHTFIRQFDLSGNLLSSTEQAWMWPADVDDDGQTEWINSLDDIGLWDVDGDGVPERITESDGALVIQRWDTNQRQFVTIPTSIRNVSPGNINVRAIWDINYDGKLDVLLSDANGAVMCYTLGEGTWNPKKSIPPHITPFLRTYQWDAYEPNDGQDNNADGLPDVFTRIPSAMTAKGAFYGFLGSATDKDYYLVNTHWNGQVCLDAPPGREYALEVYSLADKWINQTHASGTDGLPDGLVWTGNTGVGGQVCFLGTAVVPSRAAEYKFIVGITSVSGYSVDRPYWLTAPK
jgi:hypothetical protein